MRMFQTCADVAFPTSRRANQTLFCHSRDIARLAGQHAATSCEPRCLTCLSTRSVSLNWCPAMWQWRLFARFCFHSKYTGQIASQALRSNLTHCVRPADRLSASSGSARPDCGDHFSLSARNSPAQQPAKCRGTPRCPCRLARHQQVAWSVRRC